MDDLLAPVSSPLLAKPEVDAAAVRLTLEQLLAVAGERLCEEVSPRTVRLYATQGLIDRPAKDGRTAVYGNRHLLQLLLIRSLARRGLSLAAIAPLTGQEDEALEQQLGDLAAGEGSLPEARSLMTPTEGVESGQSEGTEGNEALNYLQSLKGSRSSGPKSPYISADLLPLLGSPLSKRTETSASSRSRPRTGGTREASSRWHRFTLAPGIELHVSDSVAVPPEGSRRKAWLNRLIARLVELLEET